MRPLITVIVPVYNVEKWLPRCLDSIIAQDYAHLELLVIDDGSTDSSGAICDSYANAYAFVRVIHQENRGLAAVRNLGVAEARGSFLSFIDSDDYIVGPLYSDMAKLIVQYAPDVICFGHVDVYGDSQIVIESQPERCALLELNAEQAVDQLLFGNNVDVITCNKIIRKELLDGISFPEGKLYEDMFTTYRYISRANGILCTSKRYYVYCHRRGSIGTRDFDSQNYDLVKAVDEVYEFGIGFCERAPNIEVGRLYWLVVVANMMIRSNYEDKEYFARVRSTSRKLTGQVIGNQLLPRVRKIELLLFGWCFPLYRFVYRKYAHAFR